MAAIVSLCSVIFNRRGVRPRRDVPDHKLDLVSPAANPNMMIPHDDAVK